MQHAAALGYELPKPVQGYQPTTFLERGVAVPYTTPHLVGARVRPTQRGGLELIVQNLSGRPGVYVLPLDGVHALCTPTLHDRALNARIAAIRSTTPAAIRGAARIVAVEGLAGRDAAGSAAANIANEHEQSLLAHFELLLELLRQVEPRGPGWVPLDDCAAEHLGRRTRTVLGALSPKTGRSAEAMMTMVQELALLFQSVGIGRQTPAARLSGVVRMLDDLRQQMRDWQCLRGSTGRAEAALIEATADLTLTMARVTLSEARALLSNLPLLLRRWMAEPDTLASQVARPEWLLDGWERICLLWRAADDRIDRASILAEMMALVPITPREAADWADGSVDFAADLLRRRPKVGLGEDWRTGVTVTDLVARNEQLRALSPAGPG